MQNLKSGAILAALVVFLSMKPVGVLGQARSLDLEVVQRLSGDLAQTWQTLSERKEDGDPTAKKAREQLYLCAEHTFWTVDRVERLDKDNDLKPNSFSSHFLSATYLVYTLRSGQSTGTWQEHKIELLNELAQAYLASSFFVDQHRQIHNKGCYAPGNDFLVWIYGYARWINLEQAYQRLLSADPEVKDRFEAFRNRSPHTMRMADDQELLDRFSATHCRVSRLPMQQLNGESRYQPSNELCDELKKDFLGYLDHVLQAFAKENFLEKLEPMLDREVNNSDIAAFELYLKQTDTYWAVWTEHTDEELLRLFNSFMQNPEVTTSMPLKHNRTWQLPMGSH